MSFYYLLPPDLGRVKLIRFTVNQIFPLDVAPLPCYSYEKYSRRQSCGPSQIVRRRYGLKHFRRFRVRFAIFSSKIKLIKVVLTSYVCICICNKSLRSMYTCVLPFSSSLNSFEEGEKLLRSLLQQRSNSPFIFFLSTSSDFVSISHFQTSSFEDSPSKIVTLGAVNYGQRVKGAFASLIFTYHRGAQSSLASKRPRRGSWWSYFTLRQFCSSGTSISISSLTLECVEILASHRGSCLFFSFLLLIFSIVTFDSAPVKQSQHD